MLVFQFYINFNRTICKQTVETLIRRRIMRLILVKIRGKYFDWTDGESALLLYMGKSLFTSSQVFIYIIYLQKAIFHYMKTKMFFFRKKIKIEIYLYVVVQMKASDL